MDYADVIFVISYGFEDQLKEIADKNPSKIFVNIDTVVENAKKTITSVDFIEEESAYLAGVVAGLCHGGHLRSRTSTLPRWSALSAAISTRW